MILLIEIIHCIVLLYQDIVYKKLQFHVTMISDEKLCYQSQI
jgi:hypothetical protein